MKARTVVTSVLLAALPFLLGYCTVNENRPPPKLAATGQAGTKTAGKAESRAPKVMAMPSGSIRITGAESGTVSVPAKQGGYLIRLRYKASGLKLEIDSALGALNIISGGQTAGNEGWIEFEDLTSFALDAHPQYRITATERYEIEFSPLPLPASPDTVPKTYAGSGLKILGPLSLKAGFASFKVSCPDLKQAGFLAELYDARTAQNKGVITLGTGRKVAETKKLQLPGAGEYLVKVNANGQSQWTIEVSQ